MLETRTPEAVLHVQFRRNPLAPCQPDVAFIVHPEQGLPPLDVVMPYQMARRFASDLMVELLSLEEMLNQRAQNAQEGPSRPLWARLHQKVTRWVNR